MSARPNSPCTDADIDAVENRLGRRIPASYRELLRETGGGVLDDDHRVYPDTCRTTATASEESSSTAGSPMLRRARCWR
ncbi:SMI1/KNR4 family protein [Corynebacterium sp.]|mgnify:CR=1 FL=1|jgi:cell wall assembly regulator SMI1|uniref:SMI1/KNR4 family protein n=1 Tax=Corynebacterium sp. TaxID=1720 RepID=UPI0025C2E737|nr:SMI1/KNR4 family protein [Corynebacterium sp.]